MYNDTITVFCRHENRLGDMWYPSVIHGVNVQKDKGAIIAKYGAESKDSVMLGIHYYFNGSQRKIGGKTYFTPKEWAKLSPEELPNSLTFKSGKGFDFFVLGEYANAEPISDNDFTDGFYNYINQKYDDVFAISSVGLYTVIPHFEILGK